MTFNRRTFLRFGAVGAASFAVPAKIKAWRAHRAASQSTLSLPFATSTYEEGTDAQVVPIGLGVLAVTGRPVYSSADAVHGSMGWVSSAIRGGGRLWYENSSSAGSSGSVYLTPGAFAANATATVVALAPDLGDPTFLVKIRLRWDGRVDVVDGDNVRLGLAQVRWTPGGRLRVDWQQLWDGSQITLIVWLYLDTNVEGWRPDAVLNAVVGSTEPGVVTLGQDRSKNASVGFDTYREYDVLGMPTPYDPVIGAISVHTYDGGAAGQPVVVGDPGADRVLAVGGSPSYSTAAVMHGSLGILVPPASGGGTLGYDNPYPPAHTGSVYVRTLTRGASSSQVLAFKNGSTPIGALTLSPQGNLSIADGAGSTVTETTTPAELGIWTRVDWQAVWDEADLLITARYFQEFAEGVDGYQEISASVPASTPDSLELGSTSSDWETHLDTFRTYGDVSAWPDPYHPLVDPVVQYSMPGLGAAAVPTAAVISSSVLIAPTINFGWSTSIDEAENLTGSITYVGDEIVDETDRTVKHAVTGLTPGTVYYGRLATGPGAFVGDLVQWKTLPASGSDFTVKVALGSCQQEPSVATDTAWLDCLAYDPDLLVDLGDFGYWGSTLSQSEPYDPYTTHVDDYAGQIVGIPNLRKARQRVITLEEADDQEYGGDNLDSFNNPVRQNSILAMQRVFALHPLADTSEPKRGLWGAFNLGDNIRVVMLDCISMDRSPGAALDPPEDGSSKTFLGAAQLAWWMTEMQRPETLKIVVGGKALLGDYPTGRDSDTGLLEQADWDKFWAYPVERKIMTDFIANNTTSAGGPINVDWWGADRHANAYVSPVDNPLGSFPVVLGSGWDQHGLPPKDGEAYDLAYGFDASEALHVVQYVQLELHDDPITGTITRTVRSREVHSEGGAMEPGWAGAADIVDTWDYLGLADLTHAFSLSGPVADGALVVTMLSPDDTGKTMDLAFSTSPDMTDSTLVGVQTVDADSLVHHTIAGQSPGTVYYTQPASSTGARFGEISRIKTLPASTGDWSMKIMLGSCQTNSKGSITQLAWRDILAWEPDLLIHLGDWGYWGGGIGPAAPYTKDLERYRASMDRLPDMRRAMQCAPLGSVCISDHELSDNGDPPGGMFNSPYSKRELIAFQKLMPILTWGDTREPRLGRYYSYDIGSSVRVITLDFRSPDRSQATMADGPAKKMLGDTQMAWLFATLDLTKVNLICFESNWLATPYPQNPGSPSADKAWNYFNDQQIIASFITTGGYKVAWLGGDRHYVGYLAGTSNTLGGFPCYLGSGFEKNGLALSDGEALTWEYGVNPDSGVTDILVIGYMQLVLSYVASTGVVSLTGSARVTDTQTDPDPSHWAMMSPPELTATDLWTP